MTRELKSEVSGMCNLSEAIAEKYFQKGFEQGLAQGKTIYATEVAKRLIKRGKYSIEEIAEDTDLDLEKVKEIAVLMKSS